MKILITGAMGFVGKHLTHNLIKKGHEVTGVDMVPSTKVWDHSNLTYISADTTQKGKWRDRVENMDAAINLAGKNIFSYWTASLKKQIYDSRILTTRRLVEALAMNQNLTLISTSAAGYYGDRGDAELDESKSPGEGFLADVCKDWEKEAFKAEQKGVRVVITRFGVVLHPSGGALKTMKPFFRAFLGGKLGSGKQWFPWVHLKDLIRGVEFILSNQKINGPLNLCAPVPVTNEMFTKALGDALNRPAPFRVPGFVLKAFLGEFGRSLLQSQKAIPDELLEHGFTFECPDIHKALTDKGDRDGELIETTESHQLEVCTKAPEWAEHARPNELAMEDACDDGRGKN